MREYKKCENKNIQSKLQRMKHAIFIIFKVHEVSLVYQLLERANWNNYQNFYCIVNIDGSNLQNIITSFQVCHHNKINYDVESTVTNLTRKLYKIRLGMHIL